MNTPPNQALSRRIFLRKSVVILPTATLVLTSAAQEKGSAAATDKTGATSSTATYQPAYFHPTEWVFLQAAVARLIPADDSGPGALEAGVPEFIDRQMDAIFGNAALWYMQGPYVESPPEFGYQDRLPPRDVYRAGIAATDRYCETQLGSKTFALLQPAAQDKLLQGLESGAIALEGVNARAFFGFLLQNTREGYLSDPMHGGNKNAAAWKMIGFPGARADYADWVGRPGERYPLPPVSINGPQG
ncbi:gluconate 2-dehydrogenase subunit 3 family protein [Rhodoferax sp. GW822-FHT02A01]|uniref:gluconate 2-dehydrogenase subunit 3 family protein n=1 Tax=Rhodoferax sp. GW822-FHT02A01 TaxID=3141537 RepID=UPI00315CE554